MNILKCVGFMECHICEAPAIRPPRSRFRMTALIRSVAPAHLYCSPSLARHCLVVGAARARENISPPKRWRQSSFRTVSSFVRGSLVLSRGCRFYLLRNISPASHRFAAPNGVDTASAYMQLLHDAPNCSFCRLLHSQTYRHRECEEQPASHCRPGKEDTGSTQSQWCSTDWDCSPFRKKNSLEPHIFSSSDTLERCSSPNQASPERFVFLRQPPLQP